MNSLTKDLFDCSKSLGSRETTDDLPVEETTIGLFKLSPDVFESWGVVGEEMMMGNCEDPPSNLAAQYALLAGSAI